MFHRPLMLEPVKLSDASPGPIYPVTRAEVKTHLRIDGADEDDYVDDLIEVATSKMDGYFGAAGEALITQTWRVDYDDFPSTRRLDLPFGPVQSVTVNYYDNDNNEQTLAAANYDLYEDATGPYLWREDSVDTWPDTYERQDAVRVTMVVGYGDAASDVPASIRHAMLIYIGHLHRHRDETAEVPATVENLLAQRRRLAF